MNLPKTIPVKSLRYYWQDKRGVPSNPATPTKPRNSRQGWFSIGSPGHQVPDGTEVAAATLDAAGTRGVLVFGIPWGKALGLTFVDVSIAVWKSTEAAPSAYDPANPVNEIAGRIGVPVAAGSARTVVATDIATKLLLMLAHLSVLTRFVQLGGAVVANSPSTWLGVGTVAIVSPRTWMRSVLDYQTGAMNTTQRVGVMAAVVRGVFVAGLRPAPWLIVGQPTAGQGTRVVPQPKPPVPLGTAGNYSILAKTGVTNIPTSNVSGDIGVSPAAATTITGMSLVLDVGGAFATAAQVNGKVYAANYAAPTPATLTQAVLDMQTAYTDAAGRVPDFVEFHGGTLNGETLVPGVYKWSTGLNIAGNINLHGSATDVFIFEVAGVLTLATNQQVVLSGGVVPSNVVWQVAGNVALGVGTAFAGTVLCLTDITVGASSTVVGRLLAQTAVNLNSTGILP